MRGAIVEGVQCVSRCSTGVYMEYGTASRIVCLVLQPNPAAESQVCFWYSTYQSHTHARTHSHVHAWMRTRTHARTCTRNTHQARKQLLLNRVIALEVCVYVFVCVRAHVRANAWLEGGGKRLE